VLSEKSCAAETENLEKQFNFFFPTVNSNNKDIAKGQINVKEVCVPEI
jgi:hypothetical protein